MKHLIPTLACGLLLLCSACLRADLILVADGKPNAVIITSAEAHATQAAADIQRYLEKMSGAKLAILKEGDAVPAGLPVSIVIGHTQIAQQNGVKIPAGFKEVVGDPKAFEEEGFVIATKGNRIILGGNSDGPYQGTFYAGYDFLERLGCRFYFPGEWGEVIPEKKTVSFPTTNITSRPDFAIRHNSLGGWIPATQQEGQIYYNDWLRKTKNSQPFGSFYPGVGDGFLAYLVPPREFQEKNPELFAMNKAGSRTQPLYENIAMISLVNPKTFDLAVQNLKEAFAGTRNMPIVSKNGFGISPPDGAAYDYDPEAIKKNNNFDYPNYVQHPMTSDEFFDFAARLAKVFPDKWVSTMSYAGREMPPQGVKILPNMAVMYAPISSCVMHPGNDPKCWRRQETIEIMRQWCKMSPNVAIYDYNPGFLLGAFIPERDVANFAENVKLYKDMKLKGFCPEGRKAFMQTWISYYMRSKLMWDSKADVAALKKDFYNTFFGPEAGPLVQQWWDACEQELGASNMHCHEDWLANCAYTVPFTTRIHQYVEQAGKCNMTPKQRERFNAFALIADHLEAFAAMEEAEKNLNYAEAAKQAQRMEDDKGKLIAIYSFFMGAVQNPEFTNGRVIRYTKEAKMLNGETGKLVAAVPLEAKFVRDLFNEGVLGEWYAPSFDDKGWGTENTFFTWDAQDKPEDAKGHDYNGYGWYRFTVDVPANMVNKPLKLHLGGVINEGWVWINGEYAGHREWNLWWAGTGALQMDADATGKVKAGQNVIAVRVLNNAEIGGMYRRGYLWAPNP